MNNRDHWDKVYLNKENNQMSWFQTKPKISLHFLKLFHIPKAARIIDIGGGDSTFVDFALDLGYRHITVLDISQKAIDRAKKRLQEKADLVDWVTADVTKVSFDKPFDFWHDRAVFHFLTDPNDVVKYIQLVENSLNNNATFVLGTFGERGPDKCSGLPIQRYSEDSMSKLFQAGFNKVKCIEEEHKTPFHTYQAFLFCSFKRVAA